MRYSSICIGIFFLLILIPVSGQTNENVTKKDLDAVQAQIDKINSILDRNQGILLNLTQTNHELKSIITNNQKEIAANFTKTNNEITGHDKATQLFVKTEFDIDNAKFFINIAIGLILTMIGVVMAHYANIFFAREKDKREIKKIKDYLNKEFGYINTLLILGINDMNNFIDQLKKDDTILNPILSGQISPLSFMLKYLKFLDFVTWNTITSTGSLMKLELGVLVHIQNMHDYIIEVNTALEKTRDPVVEILTSIISSVKLESQKKDELKSIIIEHFGFLIEKYTEIYTRLHDLDKLEWMKLQKLHE